MYNAHTSKRLPQLCDVINAREQQGETARLPHTEHTCSNFQQCTKQVYVILH